MDRAGEVRRTRHKALVCPQRTETTKPPPREPTARAGNSQPETPQMEGPPTHVNPGQPQQVTGDGLHPLRRPCPLCLSHQFMNLHLSHYKPTWTQGAKKGSQRVHFPRNQLRIDFFLVLGRGEKALRKNPGLVFSWKTNNNLDWALCLELARELLDGRVCARISFSVHPASPAPHLAKSRASCW